MVLIMRWSCVLSYTDHVPLEAIKKELSRHESNSQQTIIMELSCEESCCSAGNNQALITWLIMHWSRDWSCTDHVAIMHCSRGWSGNDHIATTYWSRTWLCTDHVTVRALITWLIMPWSRGYNALITWRIIHCSRAWSWTDHVTNHELISWL